ncbi:MAG: membrane protein insertase YidC [Candidatus Rokubacteria bacterium]|nr:membrane protein insertase YidC [Candidatus Rokubacteria bacterium]
MEKRAILAAVLTAALLLLYQLLFAPVPSPPPPVEAPVERKSPPAAEVPTPTPLPPRALSPAPERVVEVETPGYRARVGSDGGKLLEWVLHYRGDKPMVVPGSQGSRGLSLSRPKSDPDPLVFAISRDRLALGGDRPEGELTLEAQDAFGIRVVQRLKFEARDYRLDLQIRLENRHSVPQAIEVSLPWFTLQKWPEGEGEKFQGQRPTRVVRLATGGLERVEIGGVTDAAVEGQWIGLESEWYIAALIPRSPGFKLVTKKGIDGEVEVALKATALTLAPGHSWEGRALVYVGPKEYDRLRGLGAGLEQTINFGTFLYIPFLRIEWLAVPILWLMNFFYSYAPNYGVAIILLTVITKILFYPLTLKSMASMKGMQAMQPQVNALRAKYKSDSQRLQRETLELYRKHKINPMGGCLPMVIQIPIFYALYLVFSLSVELQNAAFLCFGRLFGIELWICDLAQQDPTYVLPILMGVSMFIQQKMTPTVGDPRQAKIMLLMPVVFTFMFLNLPSGLVLYWFVSNVLQILQQYYMDRRARPTKAAPKEIREGKRR